MTDEAKNILDNFKKNGNNKSYIYEYTDINKRVTDWMDSSDSSVKFAYCDPNMMEAFLPDEAKNNVQGQLDKYNAIIINSHYKEDSNEITFEDRESIERMDFISTGDQLIGKAISDDVYITGIDNKNHKIYISKPMQFTGENEITFLGKVRFFPKDASEDFYKYRVFLSENGEAGQYSVFNHIPNKPVSSYTFSSVIDLANYKENLVTALQEQPEYAAKFNQIIKWLYSKNDSIVRPAHINNEGNLFIDVNAYMVYTDGCIMNQKILDYFESYSNDLTRASDCVNIGVSINGFTKSTGELVKDGAIGSRFITTKDWKANTPYYIKIGRGVLEDIFLKQDTDEAVTAKKISAAYYGVAIYGDDYWSRSTEDLKMEVTEDSIMDIADPLFKVQLGEYEIFKNISFDSNPEDLYTMLQFSVIRKEVEDMKMTESLKLINKSFLDNDFLSGFTENQAVLLNTTRSEYMYLGDVDNPYSFVPPDTTIENQYFVYTAAYEGHNRKYDILISEKSGDSVVWSVKTFKAAGFFGLLDESDFKLKDGNFILQFTSSGNLKQRIEDRMIAKIKSLGHEIDNSVAYYFINVEENEDLLSQDIAKGTVFALINGRATIIKECFALYNFSCTNEILSINGQTTNEYLAFSGQTCNSDFILRDRLESYKNRFYLDDNVIADSIEQVLGFRIPYQVTTYAYNSDGSINYSDEALGIVTENPIFLDEANKTVFSVFAGEKRAIKMENNKYFKNIINNIVEYSTEEVIENNKLNIKGYFTGVDGFKFNTNKMSLLDRLLSIEKINLRSNYDKSLESTQFSKYLNVNLTIKGFFEDTDGLKLKFGYRKDFNNISETLNKFSTSAELKNMNPVSSVSQYLNPSIDFGVSLFEDAPIEAPQIKNTTVSSYLPNDEGSLKWYKNLLLVEGELERNGDSDSGDVTLSSKSNQAKDLISVNDTVEEILFLNSIGSTYKKISLVEDGNEIPIKFFDYQNEYIAIVTDKYTVFAKNNNIDDLFGSYYKEGLEIYHNNVMLESNIIDMPAECDVKSFTYECDESRYIITCNINDSIYAYYVSSSDIALKEKIYGDFELKGGAGNDINTYEQVPYSYFDSDYTGTGTLSLRDVSISKVETSPGVKINFDKLNYLTSIDSPVNADTKYLFEGVNPPEDDYYEYLFNVAAYDSTFNLEDGINIEEFWFFDKDINRWVTSNSRISNSSFASKYVGSNFKLRIYVIGYEYSKTLKIGLDPDTGSSSLQGMFLDKLRRPADGEVAIALIPVQGMLASLKYSGEASLTKIEAYSSYKTHDLPETGLITGFTQRYQNRNILTDNNLRYEVALIGKQLFVKSPVVVHDGNINITDKYLWKQATIPLQKDLNYKSLKDLSVGSAFDMINALYETALEDATLNSEFKAFLKKNKPITFAELLKSDSKNEMYFYGCEFVNNGLERILSIDKNKKVAYKVDDELESYFDEAMMNSERERMYLDYLSDYYTQVFCYKPLHDVMSEDAKMIRITGEEIVILTASDDILSLPLSCCNSREEIEDIGNWKIRTPSTELQYIEQSTSDSKMINYIYSGEMVSMPVYVSEFKKAFKITTWYVDDSIQIFAGYAQYPDNIRETLRESLSVEGISDGTDSYIPNTSKRVGFMAYSSDGGNNFKLTMSRDSNTLKAWAKDEEFTTIIKVGTEFHLPITINGIMSNDSAVIIHESDGLKPSTVADDTKVKFEGGYEYRDTTMLTKFYNNKKLSYLVGTNVYIEQRYPEMSGKGTVTSVNDNDISIEFELSGDYVFNKSNIAQVILGIKTDASIENPVEYITYSEAICSTDGASLLIKDYTEVDSYYTANRCYSINEISKTNILSSLTGSKWDTDHKVYEYDYDSGNDIYTPKNLKNKSGSDIYLCNVNGSYLLLRNCGFDRLSSHLLSMKDIFKNNYSVTNLLNMYEISETADFTVTDNDYTEVFGVLANHLIINSIKSDSSNPEMILSFVDDTDRENFIAKLIEKAKLIEYFDWQKASTLLTNFNNIDDKNRYILNLILSIEDIDEEKYNNSFDKIAVNGRYYFVDKTTGLIMTEEANVRLLLAMPYSYKKGIQTFENKPFTVREGGDITHDFTYLEDISDYPINSIYLNPKGYSGLRNNTDWTEHQPFEVDKVAWEKELLLNSKKDNVFVCDGNGTDILSKKGLYYVDVATTYSLDYNKLRIGDNLVKLRDYNYTDTATEYHFYKIANSAVTMYSPYKTINLTQRNYIKFYKGCYEVTDFDRFEVSCNAKVYTLPGRDMTSLSEAKVVYDTSSKILSLSEKVTNAYVENDEIIISVYDRLADTTYEFTLGVDTVSRIEVVQSTPALAFYIDGTFDRYEKGSIVFTRKCNIQLITNQLSKEDDGLRCSVTMNTPSVDVIAKVNNTDFIVDTQVIELKTYSQNGVTVTYSEDILVDTVDTGLHAADAEYVGMQFVYTIDSPAAEYKYNRNHLVDGLFGRIMLLKPKYKSLKELIDIETLIIYTAVDFNPNTFKFTKIDNGLVYISGIDGLEKNDYFNIKVLPVQTIMPETTVMNNPDYYTEVDKFDIDLYGFDRVFINENVFMAPPFKFEGSWYNYNSFEQYSTTMWTNLNDFKVYLCDELGNYVKASKTGDKVYYGVIGDEAGDCSAEIYQNTDIRIQPCELMYVTSYDFYKTIYGNNNNPFIEKIKVSTRNGLTFSNIESSLSENDIVEHIKTDSVIKSEASSSYNENIVSSNDLLFIDDYIDSEGFVSFLTFGPDNMKNIDYSHLCGIKYSNPFKFEDATRDYYKSYKMDNIPVSVSSSYVKDSIEDLKNKNAPAVVDITEVGVFSRNNKLLAYITHPVAQYDTRKNHISYNLIVKE